MKARTEVSAGGVVFRRTDQRVEILICKAATYHRWVLPKGLINAGETLEQAAVREVEEETGIHARLIQPLGAPEKYVYTAQGVRVFKTVHYYLMQYLSGDEKVHDHEMEDVRWVSFEEAIKKLAYQGARDLVIRARTIIENLK